MLRIGSTGDEVKSWQAFLTVQGFVPGPADGVFGATTDAATRAWQAHEFLDADGIVGPASYARAVSKGWRLDGECRWIPGKHFTPASRGPGDITLVVIHTTEGPETERRSEATAAWFADDRAAGSAHYIVDPAQVVQSIRDQDIAWHSGDKATNARSIGIEHCGKAGQTAAEWADPASLAELGRSAALAIRLCERYGIPPKRLTRDELRAGESGFCGHVDVTAVFSAGHGHHDPGEHFPWDYYLGLITEAM